MLRSSAVLLGCLTLAAAGCGGGSPAKSVHDASPQAVKRGEPPATAAPATPTATGAPAASTAAPPVASGCRMPRPRIVSARRVGRSITVQWELSALPPANCGQAALLITARSLTGDTAALSEQGSNGGGRQVRARSGTARLIDIVGPIMPPYEADISLFAQRGGRIEARSQVQADNDPSPANVQQEIARRDACRADAGMPTKCRMPPAPGASKLTGVTATSLARAVRQSMDGHSADLAIQHVACRPAWSCTVRFTLDYGKAPMRVTYALGGTPERGCWTLRGWSFTKAGPKGAGLPTPSVGCVARR
jgi:hypothetical protein